MQLDYDGDEVLVELLFGRGMTRGRIIWSVASGFNEYRVVLDRYDTPKCEYVEQQSHECRDYSSAKTMLTSLL